MRRLIIFVIILAGFISICFGQFRPSASPVKIIQLPGPRLTGQVSIEQALASRRITQQFTNQQLDFEQIGQLAWAGQGIINEQEGLRTAPSVGTTYPIKLYFATPEGMFLYHPHQHKLEELSNQDIRDRLSAAAMHQQVVADAACDIIIVGSIKKVMAKYRANARKYMLLEAGYVGENILLQAVSLGLGCVPIETFDVGQVHKLCKLPASLEPLVIVAVGWPAEQPTVEKGKEQKDIKVKRAVLIVASENFRDEELFETRQALVDAGIKTVVASTRKGTIKGMLGEIATAEILVRDIAIDDYDAIIFIGGMGARQYFDDPIALNIAREAVEKQKVLAAICIAPTILANAGVLEGVRATSFPSERVNLIKAGARYTVADVVQDGLIITGSGPKAARRFSQAIVRALK